MALVIVFVPDPAKGIDERARVVRPGGPVADLPWDMLGGGFPLEPILAEMREIGLAASSPPQMGVDGTRCETCGRTRVLRRWRCSRSPYITEGLF
jgi:hypothetical protein